MDCADLQGSVFEKCFQKGGRLEGVGMGRGGVKNESVSEEKRQTTESALEHSEWNFHDHEYIRFAFLMITAKP